MAETVVEIGDDDAPKTIEVAGLARSPWIEAYGARDWICIVGLEAPEVVVARPASRELCIAGHLDRLDMTQAYDPGGLHRVDFHAVRNADSLLIEYECGVAR